MDNKQDNHKQFLDNLLDNQELQSDQELQSQAAFLQEMQETRGFQECLKPFLLSLAQEGYPNPTDFLDKPDSERSLLLAYTKKTGETEAVKKIFSYLQSMETVRQNIINKEENKKKYAVGDDATLDEERRRLNQAKGKKQEVI